MYGSFLLSLKIIRIYLVFYENEKKKKRKYENIIENRNLANPITLLNDSREKEFSLVGYERI